MPGTQHRIHLYLQTILFAAASPLALAHDASDDEIVVTGRAQALTGIASSAAQGLIGARDLASRPILRSGELLEVVPGAAVTQHSGTGKANQYFLRGFNLDHGTDFAGFLDGVPLNMPTHGHGQGYLDLNPIIPELVDGIAYGKGPYYADVGDFSSAGYARYSLATHLHDRLLEVGVGEDGYYRGVTAGSNAVAAGEVLYGFEAQHYDGPWTKEENAHKLNGLLKYAQAFEGHLLDLTLMAYDANWDATDQVPSRAIADKRISRLGNIDPTLGGSSTRYSANLSLAGGDDVLGYKANAYAVYSDFSLFSNFTYFLDDPINGDQITQADRRWITGLNTAWTGSHDILGLASRTTLGAQLRHDRILDVALGRSQDRRLLSTVRDDQASETGLGFYLSNETHLTDWLRSIVGLRGDHYWFDVTSSAAQNSGTATDTLVSPKVSVVLGPWAANEFYLNFGRGFHSNDARGTVTRVDPVTGDPALPVSPLVRSDGAEIGWRSTAIAGLQTTVGVWYLELDSELLFVGDAGSTEPSGSSRRYGVEWSNFYRATDWLTLDLDVALTQSKYRKVEEHEIPNSVGRVITAGAVVDWPLGFFGSLRLRHFGDSPLIEDSRAHAEPTTVVNLRGGWHWTRQMDIALEVFNLFDSHDADISYFFASCLPSDPAAQCGAGLPEREGVEDLHLHPVEPRTIRATLSLRF